MKQLHFHAINQPIAIRNYFTIQANYFLSQDIVFCGMATQYKLVQPMILNLPFDSKCFTLFNFQPRYLLEFYRLVFKLEFALLYHQDHHLKMLQRFEVVHDFLLIMFQLEHHLLNQFLVSGSFLLFSSHQKYFGLFLSLKYPNPVRTF